MDRQFRILRPSMWSATALGVELIGALWMVAQALYVVPLLVFVPLLPVAFTAFACAAQRQQRRVSSTVLLALACLGEFLIVVANRSVYWQSALDVLAVPTPPGTLEPIVLLTISFWVWHLTFPIVAVALACQIIHASRTTEAVREASSSKVG